MVPRCPKVTQRWHRPDYQLHPKLEPPFSVPGSVALPATSVGTSYENVRCAPAEAENSKLVRFLQGPEALLSLTEGSNIKKHHFFSKHVQQLHRVLCWICLWHIKYVTLCNNTAFCSCAVGLAKSPQHIWSSEPHLSHDVNNVPKDDLFRFSMHCPHWSKLHSTGYFSIACTVLATLSRGLPPEVRWCWPENLEGQCSTLALSGFA